MDADTENSSAINANTNQHVVQVPKATKGNGKNGENNYSREELLSLFAIMEWILHIGTEEWEQVVLKHSKLFPRRHAGSIRCEYNTLHHKQVPPGSPNMMPEIKIGDKADISGREDKVFDIEIGFVVLAAPMAEDNGVTQESGGSFLSEQSAEDHPVVATAWAQSPSSGLSVVSSRIPRKSKDSNQEFLEMMRMQMKFNHEERRVDRREQRHRQAEWTGLVSSLVGRIAVGLRQF